MLGIVLFWTWTWWQLMKRILKMRWIQFSVSPWNKDFDCKLILREREAVMVNAEMFTCHSLLLDLCYLEHSTVCEADVTVIKTQVVWSNCCWLWEDRAPCSLMALQPRCQACLIMPSFHFCLMTDTARTNRGGRDERAGKETRKEESPLTWTADETQNACVHFWLVS